MAAFVQNPRRAPRVTVRLVVDIGYGSASWAGATDDLGPGGCLLAAGRSLSPRTPLSLVLRNRDLPDRLRVDGMVSWARGPACGVAFGAGGAGRAARAWFERLLQTHPALLAAVARSRARLPLDARLVVATAPRRTALGGDEARVLAGVRDGTTVGLAALHARLPPERFSRALFALLDQGVLASPQPEGSAAPGGLEAAVAELLGGPPTVAPGGAAPPATAEGRIARAALHFRRIAEDIALGTRER